ncbi:MAG TPA: NADH-quinone oxidoreductase subunit NuoG [Casimicrobiaceae bacterium]|nr:NADH-quinone oxidoreductase subunit NuoG [Casimicrobiaceae bacterium]
MGGSPPKLLSIEVDGRAVQVPHGSTVMDAANKLGIYVPFFCYHKKLSIAANCRMCLVQIEKAPKPQPACATPVTEGMKAWTHSEQAIKAQKGVMEFLLINHPLDCPICDQGGECQLQDLAVGYGASASRYREKKRVVFHKYMGPLISAEEMTRCIHCTRCVRFGIEIAGMMELGMSGRSEHAEIQTFVGRTVDSELSGNMIDICPVGALTSKPFRFAARPWELSRRKSVSPHDAHGSNLIVQVKNNRVMRVLPLENEAINECWLSDKDRFSYEALGSEERLTQPMLKQNGEWKTVNWQTALEFVAQGLADTAARHGADAIGALVSPHSTLEEMALAARLVRGLGSDNIDFRLRQTDFRGDAHREGIPWLGMPIADVNKLDRALVVGSFLRKDHPMLALRLRQAAKKGAQVSSVHSVDDNWLMPVAHRAIVPPAQLPSMLAEIVVAAARSAGRDVPQALRDVSPSAVAERIASSLASGRRRAILLGNYAIQHRDASQIVALAQMLASITGATSGVCGEAANSVGGYLAGALPQAGGRNAQAMLGADGAEPRRAYLVLHAEPEFDCATPVSARAALEKADLVVVLSPFRTATRYADVLLPVAPFTETSGTFVNCEGRVQPFLGVAQPLGDTRPAWKVLRVLGTMLSLEGFAFDTSEEIRESVLRDAGDIAARLAYASRVEIGQPARVNGSIERVADVPIYFADPLVRRSEPLQQTDDAKPPRARVNRTLLDRLGIDEGAQIKVRQGRGEAVLATQVDPGVPPGVVRIAAAHPSTCGLDGLSGPIEVERA